MRVAPNDPSWPQCPFRPRSAHTSGVAMTWTGYLENDTGEALSLTGWTLDWGYWIDSGYPPDTIAIGMSRTFNCESSVGKYAGFVMYAGARGAVTVSWDVPLLVGGPTYTATCTGAYASRRMGSDTPQAGGAMFNISALPQPPRPVPLAPAPSARGAAPTTTVASKKQQKYTTSPNEVPVVKTRPSIEAAVAMIKNSWPEIGEVGARTLASQWAQETGMGRYMFNNNFGNVKAPDPNVPHMYLADNSECWTKTYADNQIAANPGKVYYPDATFIQKHGCRCKAPLVPVATQPPHWASRFRAYNTLEEGATRYIAVHRGYAFRIPAYLSALLSGDTGTVAHILSKQGYYNGSADTYATNMAAHKKTIDEALGPVLGATPSPSSATPNTAPPTATPSQSRQTSPGASGVAGSGPADAR